MVGMTAKEALRDYIEGLTEDEAAELLRWIDGGDGLDTFSEDDLARIAAGREDVAAGRVHDHRDVVSQARALYER
jgi:hypothetical protein